MNDVQVPLAFPSSALNPPDAQVVPPYAVTAVEPFATMIPVRWLNVGMPELAMANAGVPLFDPVIRFPVVPMSCGNTDALARAWAILRDVGPQNKSRSRQTTL